MEHAQSRTERLLGKTALLALAGARVLVAGLGGVGSAAAEALARSGVGHLILMDSDVVTPSNLNRQLVATHSAMGKPKAEAMAARIADIAPACAAEPRTVYLTPENIPALLSDTAPDYVLDAIDTVTSKLALVECCKTRGIPIISCMGTGNKLDPTRLRVADLAATSVCPLCRVMRRELRARGIESLTVIYSDEPPLPRHPEAAPPDPDEESRRAVPGSVPFVPPVAGMIGAGWVVRALIERLPQRAENPHSD